MHRAQPASFFADQTPLPRVKSTGLCARSRYFVISIFSSSLKSSSDLFPTASVLPAVRVSSRLLNVSRFFRPTRRGRVGGNCGGCASCGGCAGKGSVAARLWMLRLVCNPDSVMAVGYPVSSPRWTGPRNPPFESARRMGIEAAMMHTADSAVPRATSGMLPPSLTCQQLRTSGRGRGGLDSLASGLRTLGIVVAFAAAVAPALEVDPGQLGSLHWV